MRLTFPNLALSFKRWAVAAATVLTFLVAASQQARAQSGSDTLRPLSFVTHHQVTVKGRPIAYTATAGEIFLSDLHGKPTASLFSFTYTKDGPQNSSRPVIFIFNGGPGSSSLWLHLGVIGPRRVLLDKEVNPSVVPPFTLADNPYSLIDVADLVFIDPVGTGFSNTLGDTKPETFYSVDSDAASVAQFMELWLSKYGRWNSPKYVIGESYGSVRAAVLPRALMGGPTYLGVLRGVTLNGIVLLGTLMNTPNAGPPSDLATALSLPGMADTAWYHHKSSGTGETLAAFHTEVSKFALSDYLPALEKLDAGTLSRSAAEAMAARLSAYTGLPASTFLNQKLRIAPIAFTKALLADQGLELGLYDGRYTLSSRNSGGDPVDDDPAMAQYVPGFIAAFHQMLRDDLKVDIQRPYGSIVWQGINDHWDWNRSGVPKGQSFAVDLATGMRRDPALKLLVASGYYDLVTQAATAEHALKVAGVPPERTTYKLYESGHMLYLGGTAEAFADDIRAFIAPGH